MRREFPDLAEGDVIATNDPFLGGSHLPDVTVVTPVFIGSEEPRFFVASRGHHADLGGRTPGSMPADSVRLAEEGVLLRAFRLVRGGRFEEARVRELLESAEFPARNPADNLADLEAMVAANRAGERLLVRITTADLHQAGHLVLGQADLLAAPLGQVQVGDLVRESFAHHRTPRDGKGRSAAPLWHRGGIVRFIGIGWANIYLYIRMK